MLVVATVSVDAVAGVVAAIVESIHCEKNEDEGIGLGIDCCDFVGCIEGEDKAGGINGLIEDNFSVSSIKSRVCTFAK